MLRLFRISWCAAAMCLACAAPETLLGQEPDEAAPAVPAAEDKAADLQATDPLERLIYVPYRNLKSVFEKPGASVIVPYEEFMELLMSQPAGDSPAEQVSAVITDSKYEVRIDGDLARIKAQLNVRVLDKSWGQVPISFGDAAVGSISSEGDKVLIRGTGNGAYELLISEAGTHLVTLELVARIRTSPDGRRIEFRCPTVGVTTVDVVVPKPNQTIDIRPRLISLPVEAAEQQTRIRASLGSTGQINIQWNPQTSAKPQMELLASVTNLLHVAIDEGLVHTDAQLDYQVLRGELSQLRIAVPLGHRILDVSSPNAKVKGWKAVADDQRQVVQLELLTAVTGRVTVDVHTERAADKQESFEAAGIAENGTVHGVHALDVVREAGQLVVTHGPGLGLTVERQVGLSRINATDVPKGLRRPDALYYRFYSPSFQINLTAKPVEPRVIVRQMNRLIFAEDQLQLRADVVYDIQRAGVFELALKVPEGVVIDEASSPVVRAFDTADGTLRLTLNQKHQGQIAVRILGHLPLQDGDQDALKMPLLEPLAAFREEGTLQVYAPAGIEVVTNRDELVGIQPQPSVSDVLSLQQARLVSSWTYNRRPVNLVVQTTRKPTRLTARAGTLITVEPELIRVATQLHFQVEHAGIDTFQFAVPEALADAIQIELLSNIGADIKQKSRSEEAEDGLITWTILMQQDVLGTQSFRVTFDVKPNPETDTEGSQAAIAVPRVLGSQLGNGVTVALSQLVGEVAIAKDRALSVTATPTGDDIERVDVRELKMAYAQSSSADHQSSVSLAYQYYKQPVQLQIVSRKFDIENVVETVVSRALVEIVIGRESMANYRCRYRLVSSERQRLRVDLPEGVEIMESRLDQNQVPLEKGDLKVDSGWAAFFVNVARNKTADQPFFLTLQFRARIVPDADRPFAGNGGRQLLRLPRIGNGTAGAVALQQLRVAIWTPEDYALVGSPQGFNLTNLPRWGGLMAGLQTSRLDQFDLDRWVGQQTDGLVDFPQEGRGHLYTALGASDSIEVDWWDLEFLVWVLSGSLLLVGWILRTTSWENKLTIMLLFGFAAGLYALADMDVVVQALIAARFGLTAALLIWLIHGLFGTRSLTVKPVRSGQPAPAVVPPPGIFEEPLRQIRRSNSEE